MQILLLFPSKERARARENGKNTTQLGLATLLSVGQVDRRAEIAPPGAKNISAALLLLAPAGSLADLLAKQLIGPLDQTLARATNSINIIMTSQRGQ